MPLAWGGWYVLTDASKPAYNNGDVWKITSAKLITPSDTFLVHASRKKALSSPATAADVNAINVYPNPYFGFNKAETDKYHRFVRINHLPRQATIRVYNLGGILVKTIKKDDPSQFAQWDLMNENGIPAAAGMYVLFIDLPGVGMTKELKLAIIPETQFLDRY